jgi:hypothetical protein
LLKEAKEADLSINQKEGSDFCYTEGWRVSFHRILPMLEGLITFAMALAFMSWT